MSLIPSVNALNTTKLIYSIENGIALQMENNILA